MAREKNKPRNDDEQQEQMTVVIFQLKGSGDTLQKGFDAVTQAFGALGPIVVPQSNRIIASRPAQGQIAAPANGKREPEIVDAEVEEELEEDQAPAAPARAGKAAGETRKLQVYSFQSNLDLNGADGVPLKQFCAQKNPQNDFERYLVASLWLMKHGGCETFTANQVFTCFRGMGWKELKDFTQPMRHLKAKKSYFDIPSKGVWKLNGHGVSAAQAVGQA